MPIIRVVKFGPTIIMFGSKSLGMGTTADADI